MDIIRSNLSSLMEKTGNLPVLTNNLLAEKVISIYEKQLINSKATLMEKSSILYDIVMTKGDEAFGKLIHCLNQSENGHIVTILGGQLLPEPISTAMENPMWFEIRPMATNYSGRKSELEELKTSWKTSQNGKIMRINLVSGLGGVGKSELCRVFVNDLHVQEEVNCIWVNSETDGSLLDSVKNLAKNLKINILDQTGKEREVSIVILTVFDCLRKKKVVIVFDNLEKITSVFKIFLKEIEKLESSGPKEIKPFVIITTRFQVLKDELSGDIKLIELEVLTPADSLAFLTRALEIQGHDEDNVLVEVARRLQYFPLDLTQAVGFIQSKSTKSVKLSGRPFGAKEYLELFDKERKDLLDFHAVSFGRLSPRSETTYINWRVAKESLGNYSQIGLVCIDLMSAISFFSPDGVSIPAFVDILKSYLNKQSFSEVGSLFNSIQIKSNADIETCRDGLIYEALNLCSEYSLFSLKNAVIYVHRLVQKVIRIELANRNGLDKKVVSVLADCFLDKFRSESLPDNCIQHAIQVWEHMSEDTQLIETHMYFPQGVLHQLRHDIKYSECSSYGSKAIEVLRSVLGEVEVTLELIQSRCFTLVLNGKYDDAGVGYKDVFKKRKELLGAEHQDTLRSEYGIGLVLFHQDKYVEALSVLENVLSAQSRVLGNEHADTLVTKDRMASVLQRQGNLDEAQLIFEYTNAVRERVLENDHRDTLAGKSNMALVLADQRKYEEALQIYYAVDKIRERVQGSEHPDTLSEKRSIATTLHKTGKNSKALSLLRDVYAKQKLVLGVDHPHTLKTKWWIDKIVAVVNEIE